MKLEEATILALQGKLLENKLNEVYTKEEISSFSELYDSSWGQAREILQEISDADKEEELMNYLEEFGTEDNPIGRTELNDILAYDWESVFDALGLDEDGKVKEDLDEARNPANDEINTKIRKTLNGSTKYMGDLKDAGLEVDTDENGKATMIRNPNKVGAGYKGMRKADLKNSNPDTDYYNYMTKHKEIPVVTDTGAITPANAFRDSTNFEKTYGANDTTFRREDRNGVSKAIPKKYKTGNKNYDIDMDKFPRKSYDGVASYEPIENKELNDFKNNKSQVADDGYLKRNLDKAQAEYDIAKQDYDKVNNQVSDVRARIAKSKAKSDKKTEATKLEETDITPDFLTALKDLFNKYLRITPITDISLEEREGLSLITVTFEDGNEVIVNVTGDSNLAVIRDILTSIS